MIHGELTQRAPAPEEGPAVPYIDDIRPLPADAQ